MPSMLGMVRVATARAFAVATRLRAPFGGESGNVLILAAVLFPVVIGAMGLGAETGYWYWTQRKLQHAADVSAFAGALRLRAGDDLPEIKTAAISVAAGSGADVPFVDLPIVHAPPEQSVSNPTLNGDKQSVEVIITRSQPRLFSAVVARFFGDGESADVTIHARAIAHFESTTVACVLALSPTASPAVTISGSTTVNLTGCDVHTNSNAPDALLLSGNGKLTADCVSSVGGTEIKGAAKLTVDPDCPKEEAGSIPDPYANVVAPVVSGTCKNKSVGSPNKSLTLTPTETHASRLGVKSMRFCGGLNVKGLVTFKPGLYIIEGGDFSVVANNSSLTGLAPGVTFFLTGGAKLKFVSSNKKNTLVAPSTGPFKGILFFGDRVDNVSHVIAGSSASTLQGAIYTAGSTVTYTGNSAAAGGCTQIIADTVTFTGNSTMKAVCDDAGTSYIATNQTVKLVE